MATATKRAKRKTPATTTGRLAIFLSYALEDDLFARAIGQRLSDIFRQSVELTYMAQFPIGVNYRALIDDAVDYADILLIIATGRKRASHSYTGYEIGYFRKSQKARKYIDTKKKIERLIIPFTISAPTPAPVDEFHGIAIEADKFVYDVEAAGKLDDKKQDPFFRLLERINGILNELNNLQPSLDEQQRTREKFLGEAKLFHQDVDEFMRSLPVSTEFPQPRLTLRVPADFESKNLKIDKRVMLSCEGPTAGLFEGGKLEHRVSWTEFSERIGSDEVALYWSDALSSLIEPTLKHQFVESVLVPSYDQTKFFRLFVSESRKFVDAYELDIYLVEPSKDAGDPFTTFLAKAIAVALGYRSLFWEDDSPYGDQVRGWRPETWNSKINELRQDLRNLLVQARAAGIAEPKNVTRLYGSDWKAIENMRVMQKSFWELMRKLYTAADAVLAESKPDFAKFDEFARTLDEFRAQTRELNAIFAVKVLDHLNSVLKKG